MENQPFFHSVSVEDYRALKRLEIRHLARVNVIGGMNGAGKTSLLEALFMLLNLGDPLKLVRPLLMHGLVSNVDLTKRLLFHRNSSCIRISASTRIGPFELQSRYESQPLAGITPASVAMGAPPSQSAPNTEAGIQISRPATMGFTVTTSLNGQEEITRYMDALQPGTPPGVTANRQGALIAPLPQALLVPRAGIGNPHDQATWYTSLAQNGRKGQLLALAQAVLPKIQDVTLLHFGGTPQICGVLDEARTYLPISLMGEGASIAIGIVLALLDMSEGVLLLDEFDTALHYSVLEQVWALVGQFARDTNSQIIAVTHSQDCIEAATRAFEGTEYEDDLQYIRLDKLEQEVKATDYSTQSLADAMEGAWEVR
jgi:energy-coupling factor transporter ATP-binding protein EcfA2